jgi:hypothetical protein
VSPSILVQLEVDGLRAIIREQEQQLDAFRAQVSMNSD